MYYSAVCPSPLGMLTLGSDGEHLIGLWLEGQKYFGGAVRELSLIHISEPTRH